MNRDNLRLCKKIVFFFVFSFYFLNNSYAQVQTQTKITKDIYRDVVSNSLDIGGYLLSLPVTYDSLPSKKYPLLIFVHGAGEGNFGDGSQASLDSLTWFTSGSIPHLIRNGKFPSSFTVNGETFSFIVISPQYHCDCGIFVAQATKAMIDTAIKYYRVDTNRIYVTGLSWGGYVTKAFYTNPARVSYTNLTAASVLVSPNVGPGKVGSTDAPQIGDANLPIWVLSNSGDPSIPINNLKLFVDSLNMRLPKLNDTAKLTIFNASGHDGWTRAYNPDSSWNGLNVYQWMLQFTNEKLVAKAGPDQTFNTVPSSVLLDASRSHARQGRISSFAWTKLSGPATGTLTPDANGDTATLSSAVAGTYSYQLTVTHTNGSTKKDTVNIIINALNTQTKVSKVIYRELADNSLSIGGYLESLPGSYSAEPTKKFPLIVYLHREGSFGTGSLAALDTLANETGGIPELVKNGNFPASFAVDGKNFSFIIVSPQFTRGEGGISLAACIKAMIDTAIKYYRVDTNRIYITGASWGGYAGNTFYTNSLRVTYTNQTAASVLVCPLYQTPGVYAARATQISNSNLPLWFFGNSADPNAYAVPNNLKLYVDTINNRSPQMVDTARRTIFTASTHDAWTATYNPANSWNGLNIYQWMLQFTNEKLVANAGLDQKFTVPPASVILNASKSKARQGRISSSDYVWTKLSGPSGGVPPSGGVGKQITLTGFAGVGGTYTYKLTVTHTDGTTKSDTMNVITNATSPRIAAPVQNSISSSNESATILDVTLNPNPVRSNLTVWITGKSKGKSSLTLYNMQGQRLSQQEFIKDSESPVSRVVNAGNLPAGHYAIQVIVNKRYTKLVRFIKE